MQKDPTDLTELECSEMESIPETPETPRNSPATDQRGTIPEYTNPQTTCIAPTQNWNTGLIVSTREYCRTAGKRCPQTGSSTSSPSRPVVLELTWSHVETRTNTSLLLGNVVQTVYILSQEQNEVFRVTAVEEVVVAQVIELSVPLPWMKKTHLAKFDARLQCNVAPHLQALSKKSVSAIHSLIGKSG